jgi:hypothetical protein
VNKHRRTDQSRLYGAALRPDAEAGSGLRDALGVPAHPVALFEFGSDLCRSSSLMALSTICSYSS